MNFCIENLLLFWELRIAKLFMSNSKRRQTKICKSEVSNLDKSNAIYKQYKIYYI